MISYVSFGAGSAGSGNISVAYPDGISKGNLIVVVVARHHAETLTVPAGYSLMDSAFNGTAHIDVLTKTASGTESGGSLAISVTGTTRNYCLIQLFSSGKGLAITANAHSTASSASSITNTPTAYSASIWFSFAVAFSTTVASSNLTTYDQDGWSYYATLSSDAAGDHLKLSAFAHEALQTGPTPVTFTHDQTYTDLVSLTFSINEVNSIALNQSIILMDPWRPPVWTQPTQFTLTQMNQLRSNVLGAAMASLIGPSFNVDGPLALPGIGWNYASSVNRIQRMCGTARYPSRKYWHYGDVDGRIRQRPENTRDLWIKMVPIYAGTQIASLRFWHSTDAEASYQPVVDEFNRNELVLVIEIDAAFAGSHTLIGAYWQYGDYGD